MLYSNQSGKRCKIVERDVFGVFVFSGEITSGDGEVKVGRTWWPGMCGEVPLAEKIKTIEKRLNMGSNLSSTERSETRIQLAGHIW
jgi:hypothetical protein